MKYFILLYCLINIIKAQLPINDELSIQTDILNGYIPDLGITNSPLYIKLMLTQIKGLDEGEGTMSSSTVLSIKWIDIRLAFTPINGIDQIFVKANLIWLPDLSVINSAGTKNGFINYDTQLLVSISSTGEVN